MIDSCAPIVTTYEGSQFVPIHENIYLCERPLVQKTFTCECSYDPETDSPSEACGDSCLNRIMYYECNPTKCPCGKYCTNQSILRNFSQELEIFKTQKKGWGVRAKCFIPAHTFITEYFGEIVDYKEFLARVREYDASDREHYYFMTLSGQLVIDATKKGGSSRYINHSCEPNCETQKWHVNGEFRIGIFSIKDIEAGEEFTFDYKYERYGAEAQPCYCESAHCRGTLGGAKTASLKSISAPIKKGRLKEKVNSSENEFEHLSFDDKIASLVHENHTIHEVENVLRFIRLMLETTAGPDRDRIIQILSHMDDPACLKQFVKFHGLNV
eukprot:Sdes_comp14934_c0_seq1m3634